MISQPPRRPSPILGQVAGLKVMNGLCWGLFAVLVALPIYSLLQSRDPQGRLLRTFDADFVYFYTMGRLLNEYPANLLYNYSLQRRISDEVHPLTEGFHAPIPYPPYVGIFFQAFARLPYVTAYFLWLSISLLLYLAGVTLVSTRFLSPDPLRLSLIYCLTLSFYPFAVSLLVQ